MTYPNLIAIKEPTTWAAGAAPGTGWSNPGNATDSNDGTISTTTLTAGSSAQQFEFSGFDFAYIPVGQQISSYEVIIRCRGTAFKDRISSFYLMDGTTALSTNLAGSFINVVTYSSTEFMIKATLTGQTISTDSFKSANFKTSIIVTNSTGTTTTYGIYFLKIVPRYNPVPYTTTNYGLKIKDSTGTAVVNEFSTFPRIVQSNVTNTGFSGTISAPDFDEAKGIFFPKHHYDKRASTTAKAKTYSWSNLSFNSMQLFTNSSFLPTLSWDNSSKLLTVSPATLPAGFMQTQAHVDITIYFLHYR